MRYRHITRRRDERPTGCSECRPSSGRIRQFKSLTGSRPWEALPIVTTTQLQAAGGVHGSAGSPATLPSSSPSNPPLHPPPMALRRSLPAGAYRCQLLHRALPLLPGRNVAAVCRNVGHPPHCCAPPPPDCVRRCCPASDRIAPHVVHPASLAPLRLSPLVPPRPRRRRPTPRTTTHPGGRHRSSTTTPR